MLAKSTWSNAIEMAERLKRIGSRMTVNTLDLVTVNTKMLLAGWVACSIEVDSTDDQYQLAINPMWRGKTDVYTGDWEPREFSVAVCV